MLELRDKIKQLKSITDGLIKSNGDLQQKTAYYKNPCFSSSQNLLACKKQKGEANCKSGHDSITRHIGAIQKSIPQKSITSQFI